MTLNALDEIKRNPVKNPKIGFNKFLFILPIHEKVDSRKKKRESKFAFPAGVGFLATLLLEAGIEVEILDAHVEQMFDEEVAEALEGKDFDAVGISAFSTQYSHVKTISAAVKKKFPAVPIIVGGPLGTYSWDLVLKKLLTVDVAVRGEGELTIVDLLENFGDLKSVPGIAWRNESGEVIENPERELIKNLDTLPLPAYHLFNMDKYLSQKLLANPRSHGWKNSRIIGFMTARGCPFKCTFCSRNFPGFRKMSTARIIRDIELVRQKYGVDAVAFIDELLVISKKRMNELCNALEPLGIKWTAQGRVDTLDKETMRLMKRTGCLAVGFGIESGSQQMLDNIKKGIRVPDIERAVNDAVDVGLEVKIQLMIGNQGETRETVMETVALFKRIHHPPRRFSVLQPLPGSPVYEDAMQMGLIEDEENYLENLEVWMTLKSVLEGICELSGDEIYRVKADAEEQMRRNWNSYLWTHPLFTLRWLARIVRDEVIFRSLHSRRPSVPAQ